MLKRQLRLGLGCLREWVPHFWPVLPEVGILLITIHRDRFQGSPLLTRTRLNNHTGSVEVLYQHDLVILKFDGWPILSRLLRKGGTFDALSLLGR